MVGYININSIRNKLSDLKILLDDMFDLLAISETKLDESFPTGQILLEGYKKPYRLDKSSRSGGLLVYVKNDIPSKLLTKFEIPKDIQIVPVELNLRKQKWLIISIYKPPNDNTLSFFNALSSLIDFYTELTMKE